ncbi:MAG: hypothetical protein ACK5JF_05970 [Oscillospiraceae bacterium]
MSSNNGLKKKEYSTSELDALLADDAVDGEETKSPKPTHSQKMLDIVDSTGTEFFHTERDEPFAAIPVDGHFEICNLGSKAFRARLAGWYYQSTGRAIGNNAINEAIDIMTFSALYLEKKERILHTRVAGTSDAIYYDLGNKEWDVVHVMPGSWTVTNKLPPMFRRFTHQLPQVIPIPGGDIRKILDFVSIKKHRFLFMVWLVSSFVPGIPRPLLTIYGEKGAAKTTTCEFLKSVIDPSLLKTLTLSKDSRNLLVNLLEHWLVPFDNVSYLDEETSDFLCRAITGGGVQNRTLYSDSDSVTYSFQRGIVLNGISNVATRPDLLDRSVLLELERILEDERRELSTIQAEFEDAKASILGGVFDTLAAAMKIYPTVKLDKLPRMADFAKWGYAIGEALEDGGGERFLQEYAENRETQNAEAIANDPVAALILALMSVHSEWRGSAALLLQALRKIVPENGVNTSVKSFPPDATRLSKRLNGIRSNLEAAGVSFEKYKSNGISGLRFTMKKEELK